MTVTDSRWSWTLLRAGSFKLDGGAMFGLTPRPLWERLVTPDDRHRIPLQQNCLLLEREGSLVLIEAGIGDKLSDKL
ncbi:MAG: MBL fold metallo-hydrolase, partial [Planctomycetota bacterium]